MNFNQLRERYKSKYPAELVAAAVKIALDMAGAMTPATKKIDAMKRGLSDDPIVRDALRLANESVKEAMSAADKKKRLDMIRKAVEKLNMKADAQAKKDALAAIKAMESVEESIEEKFKPYVDKNFPRCVDFYIQFRGGKGDRITSEENKKDFIKATDMIDAYIKSNKIKQKPVYSTPMEGSSAYKVGLMIDQTYSKTSDYKDGKDLQPLYVALSKLKTAEDHGGGWTDKVGPQEGEVNEKDKIKYRGNLKDLMSHHMKEGLDTRERNLNYKLKELEYKMKLKDFMKDMVDAKLPKNKEKKEADLDEFGTPNMSAADKANLRRRIADRKKNNKKVTKEEVESFKVNDTSSNAFNKLSKIARDIGVELSREENHLLIQGDAKKLEDFKTQMKVAMKESVLNEGLSKNITDKEVDKQFKSMRDPEGFYGDLDVARAEMKKKYNPSNSARPKVWTSLSYPVRDGDYYFAFIAKNEKTNMKWNQKLNDLMLTFKYFRMTEDMMWKEVSDELVKYPKSLGWNDTMTREEIYGAILHILGKIKESKITETPIKTKAGVMLGKRGRAPQYIKNSVGESTLKTLSQIRENADFRKLVSKYKNEAKKLQRLGQAFPEAGSRFYDDLATYIYDNEPSVGDDPDDLEAEMESMMDDLVKGRR